VVPGSSPGGTTNKTKPLQRCIGFFIIFNMQEIGCYILYSENLSKYYIGACQDNLEDRIIKHNTSFYGSKCFTSTSNDWELKLFIPTQEFSQVIRLEKKVKTMKSKIYIQNLLKYPELIEKIFNETKST
jgi:putative endonuclease